MDYIELSCTITPYNNENSEILIAVLSVLGYESFMNTEKDIKAYIKAADFDLKQILSVKNKNYDFHIQISYQRIQDNNWNEIWEKNYFKPIFIDKKCVVRASFHEKCPEAECEIIINPKTTFGTGYHATTYLIMKEIINLKIKKKNILDMGCGTGILSVLSKKLGSGKVLAVDNDEKACSNTLENIGNNNLTGIDVIQGTIASLNNEKFDIIYENILKNIVIADIPVLSKHIKKEGILIVSGFSTNDIEDIKSIGEESGLTYKYFKEKDDWAIVKFIKE